MAGRQALRVKRFLRGAQGFESACLSPFYWESKRPPAKRPLHRAGTACPISLPTRCRIAGSSNNSLSCAGGSERLSPKFVCFCPSPAEKSRSGFAENGTIWPAFLPLPSQLSKRYVVPMFRKAECSATELTARVQGTLGSAAATNEIRHSIPAQASGHPMSVRAALGRGTFSALAERLPTLVGEELCSNPCRASARCESVNMRARGRKIALVM